MPPDDKTELSPEEQRRQAAERALQANASRNAERLARMEEIADSAEQTGEHLEDQEVTDEMWADQDLPENVRTARAMAKATAEAEPEIEEEKLPTEAVNDQAEERKDEEAREAGADDVRENADGVKEYRLVINGKERWQTLEQIRATAQKVDSADEYLQIATDTVRKATRAAPTAEEKAEADRAKKERVAHRKALLLKVAMGDEQAAEELAELDDNAAPSAVTPDVLRALDERFDSRVTFREAVTWFEGEYADVLKHQAMKSYAGELDAALAAQNPQMVPRERLRRVGEQIRRELRETYGLARSGSTEPSEKARRKAEVRRPTPAGERQPTKADEDETEDTQSVIQKMAQGRHQPRAVVHGPIRNR